MSLSLILFFLSLLSIITMISRKIVLVRNGQVVKIQHLHPFVPDLIKIKHFTFKNTKKIGYTAVFLTLRFFIKSSNFIKNESKILIKKIESKLKKNKGEFLDETIKQKEVSKYLKVIGEYRQKIREMKHKIKEEEGIK